MMVELTEVCSALCPFCAGTSKSDWERVPRFDYRNQFDAQHNGQKAWIHRPTYGGGTHWEHVDCKASKILAAIHHT